jgi:hypothetical protein
VIHVSRYNPFVLNRSYITTLLLICGCARISVEHEPVFHTPLVKTAYSPPKRSQPSKPQSALPDNALRKAAVVFAEALLSDSNAIDDFGETDVAQMLQKTKIHLSWTAADGVVALARLSRREKAYAADGRPLPGDIVLFHNQRDLNENGENDDWLTGCGIVTRIDSGQFEAVIRTGNTPRRIVVTPLIASTRTMNGSVINSYVRIPNRQDPKGTAYLAGQLYAGHINIEKLQTN